MKIDIIIVNSNTAAANTAAQYVYLKGHDWVYICDDCTTWEVFDMNVDINTIQCWCCSGPYVKYRSKNYA